MTTEQQQQQWGENVTRGRTIERVATERWPLERTGQSDQTAWWHDARTRAPIMPRRGLGVIVPGTPVEIKGCQLWTHDHGRRGRWLVREHCHERLLERDGEYLLVVYREGEDDPAIHIERFVPAWRFGTLIESWYQTSTRDKAERVAQVPWSRAFGVDGFAAPRQQASVSGRGCA